MFDDLVREVIGLVLAGVPQEVLVNRPEPVLAFDRQWLGNFDGQDSCNGLGPPRDQDRLPKLDRREERGEVALELFDRGRAHGAGVCEASRTIKPSSRLLHVRAIREIRGYFDAFWRRRLGSALPAWKPAEGAVGWGAMSPRTLSDVAAMTLQGGSFDLGLANFLDEFYAVPNEGALAAEPPLLVPSRGEVGARCDAYLAATAEELARAYSLRCPGWTAAESRWLHRPWFASPLASLRAVLILESPPAFRARNLFVSENALTRV